MPEGQMPQTTKQHPVPQNIMEVEFKLIGDLTIRQFGFVAISGVIAFLIYKSALPGIFRWPLALTSIGFGLGMAFLPIQDRGLDKWVINFLNSIYSPTQMVWRKEPPPPLYLLSEYEHMVKSEIISLAPVKSRRKLQEFLKTLPKEVPKTDIDVKEESFLESIDFDIEVPETLRPVAVPIKKLPSEEAPKATIPPKPGEPPKIIKQPPKTPPEEEKPKAVPAEPIVSILPKRVVVPKTMKLASEINFSEQPVFTITTPEAKKQFVPAIKTVKPGRKLTALPSLEGELILPVRGEKVIPSFEEVERAKKEALEKVEREEEKGISLLKELQIATTKAKQRLEREPPITEPVSKPEKKLPPDKERQRLEAQVKMLTSRVEELQKQAEEKKDAADVEKTISYYQKQIGQLQQQLGILQSVQKIEKKPTTPEEYQKQIEETQRKAEKALSEIRKTKKQIEEVRRKIGEDPNKRRVYEKEIQKQEEKVSDLERQRELTMETIARLLRELRRSQRLIKGQEPAPKEKPGEEAEEISGEKETLEEGIPNIISGTVEDRQGRLLENIVVLVKDKNDDPVRALKTNKLGQFSITTPLPNGKYTVEVSVKEREFDIIRVELNGSVLKSLKIVEK